METSHQTILDLAAQRVLIAAYPSMARWPR